MSARKGGGGEVFETRKWVEVGLALLLVHGAQMLLNQADIVMVGLIRGTTDAGIYSVATRFAFLVATGLGVINVVTAPIFSEIYGEGSHERLQKVLTLAGRASLFVALPVIVALGSSGAAVLGLFGAEFTVGSTAMLILAGAQLTRAAAGPLVILLGVTGHHRSVAQLMGASAIINVGLNYWMVGLWGMEGAAVATCITVVFSNLALIWLVHRMLELRATALGFV